MNNNFISKMFKTLVYNGVVFGDYTWDDEKQSIIGKKGRYLTPKKLNYGSIVKIRKKGVLYTIIIEDLSVQMNNIVENKVEQI